MATAAVQQVGMRVGLGMAVAMTQRRIPRRTREQAAAQPVITGADMAEMRRRVGLSQAELARRLGYKRAYICDLEHGRRRMHAELVKHLTAVIAEAESERAALMALRSRYGVG